MVTYLLQPVTIVGSPLFLMDWMEMGDIMGRSSAHGKRQVDKRIRQSQILEEGSNITFWILVIRDQTWAAPPKSEWKRCVMWCVTNNTILFFEHTGIWGRAGHADSAYGFMRICVSKRICANIFQFRIELLGIGLYCRWEGLRCCRQQSLVCQQKSDALLDALKWFPDS